MANNIVEQAVRRLEALRRSGAAVPGGAGDDVRGNGSAAPGRAKARPVGEGQSPGRFRGEQAQRPARTVEVDLDRLAAMGYLTPESLRTQIANEFRVVKRPILANVDGRVAGTVDRANLIMVTSSMAGEGKTFVSVNLAMSIAMELDRSVLLVDADVSRPMVMSRLGLPPARGLLDVLTDPSITADELMLATNIDKLTVLPAGAPQGRATELLASDAMSRLLQDWSTGMAGRVVVFDAPPLLPSTESRVLATRMGQVVLVVEAEKTTQKLVEQALATLEACPVVLPLLNKTSRSEVGAYYGYHVPESQ